MFINVIQQLLVVKCFCVTLFIVVNRLITVCVLLASFLFSGQQKEGIRGKANQTPDNAKGVSFAPSPGQPSGNPADTYRAKGNEHAKDNSVNLVSVPEKIPIDPIRDRFDIFLAICTAILTVVGVVGTCAAIKTLRAINRQAQYMLVHARHLDKIAKSAADNAAAALKSIEAVISKERARIRIRPDGLILVPPDKPFRLDEVIFRVICMGTTPAFVTERNVTITVTDSNEPPERRKYETPLNLPPVVVPTDDEGLQRSAIFTEIQSDESRVAIKSGKLFVHFYGNIKYKDVFFEVSNKMRETRFRYIWHVTDIRNIDGSMFSYWKQVGGEEENFDT